MAAAGSRRVVFEDDQGSSGNAASSLWVTDGTATGTYQLAVANLGSDAGGHDFVSLGGLAVFSFAVGEAGGSGLWVSDGTASGQVKAKTRRDIPFVIFASDG